MTRPPPGRCTGVEYPPSPARRARALAQRGNPEDLQAALKELDSLLALDRTAYEAHVLAADLHTALWQEQRVAASEGRAREHLAHAEKLESPS